MPVELITLTIYAVWTLLLGMAVVWWRAVLVLQGKSQSNEFASGQKHGSDPYWRLNRAHINAAENLPIFAVVCGLAVYLSVYEWIEALAIVVVVARLIQSTIHISSNHVWAVNLRFSAMLVQQFAILGMVYRIVQVVLDGL
ncbi:MAG: MAPEG family protein [Leptospiraceae bacterium]|nr:MAPEG family protein [Leptospiraceae bacterium]